MATTLHETNLHETRLTTRERLRMRRSRGAASGLLLVVLGLWGGLVPFVGPAFGYGFTPDQSWHLTQGRLLLEVLPAAAVVLGGLAVMGSASRVSGWLGAWVAVAGGAWFVTGQWFSTLWNGGVMAAGQPISTSRSDQVAEWLGCFLGLGVVIVFLAALAMGRMSVVSLRDARYAAERASEREAELEAGRGAGRGTGRGTGAAVEPGADDPTVDRVAR